MPAIPPPSEATVRAFGLDPFYRKCLLVRDLPVVGSERPPDSALREAAFLVEAMLRGRDDLCAALVRRRVRVAVMAASERTTALPEHRDLTPKAYWDRRARGLGATPWRPAVSGAEENLLSYPGDPYAGESILIHEFAHTLHERGIRTLDPDFDRRLEATHRAAREKALWKGTYADTNPAEYWAEGVQSWFDANQARRDASHNGIATRAALKRHDPALAALIASVFPRRSWRYVPVARRAGRGHLAGYDPAAAPRFVW